MNKEAPWSVKGVDFDAREAAREAARRSGMSLGEWLNSVISEEAAASGVDVDDIDESGRLEAVTARLAQMSKRPQGRTSRRDDSDPGESLARRRRPAPVRGRGDDDGRERSAFGDPEYALDEAIRAYERGARRGGERTADAISQVARRLEDIERRLSSSRQETSRNESSRHESSGQESRRQDSFRDEREASFRDEREASSTRDAIAKMEARLEALARRGEIEDDQPSLRGLERKINAIAERSQPETPAASPTPVPAAPDIARIEAKLNRLLDSAARQAPQAQPHQAPQANQAPPAQAYQAARVHHAAPFRQPAPQVPFADAVAQITRRQRMLDTGGAAPPRQSVRPPAPGYAEPFSPGSPALDMQALQRDIAGLAGRLEQTRRDVLERHDSIRPAPAPLPEFDDLRRRMDGMSGALTQLAPRDSVASIETAIRDLSTRVDASSRSAGDNAAAAVFPDISDLRRQIGEMSGALTQLAPREAVASIETAIRDLSTRIDASSRSAGDNAAGAVFPDISGLRRQISEISGALTHLAPREAVASVETAIRELSQKVETSRQSGVRETLLRPIEDLAGDIRQSLAEFAPAAGLEGLGREIRAMAAKVDAVAASGLDSGALRDIHARSQEMRDLLARALAAPVPMENIERQIAGLAEKVERLSSRAPAASDDSAVIRGIGDIRKTIDQSLPAGFFGQLESRIEVLSAKIDDAVSQSGASDQFDELAKRIDNVHLSLSARPAPAAAEPVDTSALERMMRDLAGKLERPAPADTNRLEEMVQSLGERLSFAGAPQTDLRLVESLQGQIARLAEKVEAAGQSRSDSGIIGHLQTEMARFAEHFEAGRPREDAQNAAALQRQMEQISERLDKGDASARALVSLETTIGDLFHRFEDIRGAAVDAAALAARDTVTEALQRQQTALPGEGYSRDLADLRSMQDAADRRTHATLTAVHETLEKVVDRLALLEEDLAEVRPEPLASGAAPVFARAAPDPAPKFAPAPPREAEKPIARPPAPAEDALDDLIEPGSGLPPGRRGGVHVPVADLARPTDQTAQSSFIAAARRAAQAASGEPAPSGKAGRSKSAPPDNALTGARDRARAAHIAIAGATAAEPPAEAGPGRFAKLRTFAAARKRLMIFAAVGVGAVVAAVPAMRLLREPETRPEIVDLTGQKTSQRAVPPGATGKQQIAGTALPPGLTQGPADIAGASRFTPGPATAGPGQSAASPPASDSARVDTSPVGSITGKPGAPAPQAPTLQAPTLQASAAAGNPAAQFELASRYADGRTVARDPRLALQWFEKAAQQNSAPAQYRVGSHYERGLGVERDAKKAREWYLRAAEGGNVRAMHNLAVLAAEGIDGKPDYATAAAWFRKASEYGVRDSEYNLAILYARGLGIEQNLQLSWAWFQLAAAQGDEDAAKKRDDVTARLDAKGLAAAKAIAEAFKPKSSERASNEVAPPPGGWDQPARAENRPPLIPPPGSKPLPKGKVTSL